MHFQRIWNVHEPKHQKAPFLQGQAWGHCHTHSRCSCFPTIHRRRSHPYPKFTSLGNLGCLPCETSCQMATEGLIHKGLLCDSKIRKKKKYTVSCINKVVFLLELIEITLKHLERNWSRAEIFNRNVMISWSAALHRAKTRGADTAAMFTATAAAPSLHTGKSGLISSWKYF